MSEEKKLLVASAAPVLCGEMPEGADINDPRFVVTEFKSEEAEKVAYSNYSYWKSTWNTFTKSKGAVFALILMFVIVSFAFLQPHLPNQQRHDFSEYLMEYEMWKHPPTAKHWFGTDDLGRDLWARTWYGARISIELAVVVAFTEIFVGLIVGAIWGYVKAIDRFMTEVYNLVANIPSIILLVLLSYMMTPGFWTMYVAMSLTGWLYMARAIRNQVLIIRDREYNLASRCLGTPAHRMIMRNLIPHLVSVIIMRLAFAIPGVIAGEATLTFLGVGLPLEVPSLGVLISSGRSVFHIKPHLLGFPAIVISLITVSFYISGNAFADASDPRNHQ